MISKKISWRRRIILALIFTVILILDLAAISDILQGDSQVYEEYAVLFLSVIFFVVILIPVIRKHK